MASAGKLHIPRCPWGERLVDELCKFPSNKANDHDDAADVMSLFGRGLEDMIWSEEKVPEPIKKGVKFGSWDWLTYGTEPKERAPRVF